MRRILVSCAVLAVLVLPAAATARAPAAARPGFLVVRQAVGDGGVNGSPVVTLIVTGFVLGRVSREAQVKIVQLPRLGCQQCGPDVVGADVSSTAIKYRGRFSGKAYNGSNFRFRAQGGTYRVVVRGSGVYLFAGGQGRVTPADLDAGMKHGAGWPMGPCELVDLVGIDVHVHASEALWEKLREPRMAPPARLVAMANAGLLGRKSGRGFYTYNG